MSIEWVRRQILLSTCKNIAMLAVITTMKTYIIGLSVLVLGVGALLGGYQVAFAQSTDAAVEPPIERMPAIKLACVSLDADLAYGSTDASSHNRVTTLQQFLSGKGYFDAAQIGTGHFGPLTRAAVVRFQASQGVPATGYVGPLTRAAIIAAQGDVCSTATSAAATLYTVSPSSGKSGDTISITGRGFSNDNIILIDGLVAARNVPIASSIAVMCTNDPSCHGGIRQTLTFEMPSSIAPYCAPAMACPLYIRLLTPGTYQISVKTSDAASTSNSLPFKLTKVAEELI